MQDATAQPRPDAAAVDMSLGRRILRAAGWTFIWLGALTLGFVAHQLWVTSYFAERAQTGLAEERLAHYEEVEISEAEYVPLVEDDQGNLVAGAGGERPTILVEAEPAEGEAFAEIRIPRLEELADGWTIIEGVTIPLLRSGAGHMPATPLPGQPGNLPTGDSAAMSIAVLVPFKPFQNVVTGLVTRLRQCGGGETGALAGSAQQDNRALF